MWNPLSQIPLAAQPKVVTYENNNDDSRASQVHSADFFDGDFVVLGVNGVADASSGASDDVISSSSSPLTASISPVPQHPSTVTKSNSPNRTVAWGKLAAAPDAGRDEAEFPSLATGAAIAVASKKRELSKIYAPSSSPRSVADHFAVASLERGFAVEIVGPYKNPAPIASTEAHKGFTSKVAEGALSHNSKGLNGGLVKEKFTVLAGTGRKSFNIHFAWNGHKGDWKIDHKRRRSKNTHLHLDKGRKQARAEKAAGW